MIEDPANDRACLDQFTRDARELARTTFAYKLAARLRTKRNVIAWLQQKPQRDDDGTETVQVNVCDVPQRNYVFGPMPNCIERARDAMALYEVIDPKGRYKLVTIEKPLRHTALVEWDDDAKRWEPVDLFPRRNGGGLRNLSWGDVGGWGKTAVQYVHPVGKTVLGYFGLGAVGDYAEKGWQSAGVLPKDQPKPQAPPPQQQQPRPTPAPSRSPPAPAPAPPRPVVVSAPPAPVFASPAPVPSPPVSSIDQGGTSYAAEEPDAPAPIWWPPRAYYARRKATP